MPKPSIKVSLLSAGGTEEEDSETYELDTEADAESAYADVCGFLDQIMDTGDESAPTVASEREE